MVRELTEQLMLWCWWYQAVANVTMIRIVKMNDCDHNDDVMV